MGLMGKLAPRTMDRYMEASMFSAQQDPERPAVRPDSLHEPGPDGEERGPYRGRIMQSSAYTSAMLSGVTRVLPFIAAGAVFAAGMRRRAAS
jgi:hypothetical protein